MFGELQDHRAARLRAPALHEAHMFGRDLRVEREVELTHPSPLTPFAQQIADGPGGRYHSATIIQRPAGSNYLAGNRHAACAGGIIRTIKEVPMITLHTPPLRHLLFADAIISGVT